MCRLVEIRDKGPLRSHFEKDTVLFAYHLGDLDPFFFDRCRWLGWVSKTGQISEVGLVYCGPDLPTVLLFGLSDAYSEFVDDICGRLPDAFYCHYQPPALPVLSEHFGIRRPQKCIKMKLGKYQDYSGDESTVRRLDRSHSAALEQLFAIAYPESYFDPRMLDTDKCFGTFDHERLVATAGVHVHSPEYHIAAIGNVATHPEFRGHGLATMVTSHLVRELLRDQMTITLNVAHNNVGAISCYRRIGFVATHEYCEGLMTRPQGALES